MPRLQGTTVLTLLALGLALAAATDYSCGKGKSEAEITIENNDIVEFKTQDPKKYKQAKCTVKYILGASCAKMKFDCRQNAFSLAGGRKCNKKSKDKLSITTDEGKKTFCGKIKKKKQRPNISTAGNITVSFVADKKKHSFGATCEVSCTEAATGATTSAPTGTTTGQSTSLLNSLSGTSFAPSSIISFLFIFYISHHRNDLCSLLPSNILFIEEEDKGR